MKCRGRGASFATWLAYSCALHDLDCTLDRRTIDSRHLRFRHGPCKGSLPSTLVLQPKGFFKTTCSNVGHHLYRFSFCRYMHRADPIVLLRVWTHPDPEEGGNTRQQLILPITNCRSIGGQKEAKCMEGITSKENKNWLALRSYVPLSSIEGHEVLDLMHFYR